MVNYVTVRNVSAHPYFVRFLPPHGRMLEPMEAVTLPAEALAGKDKDMFQAVSTGALAFSFTGTGPSPTPAPAAVAAVAPPTPRQQFFAKHRRHKRRIHTEE